MTNYFSSKHRLLNLAVSPPLLQLKLLPNHKSIVNSTSSALEDTAGTGSTFATSTTLAAASSGESTASPAALHITASSELTRATVTSSSSGSSTGTATSVVEEPDATTSPIKGKANGQRKGQKGGNQGVDGSKNGNDGASPTGANDGTGNASKGNSALILLASNVQNASDARGIDTQNAEKAQAASATAPNNFINFCSGKTLTNGLQVKSGSCNGIVMGEIPSTANMVSQIITFPEVGKASKLKAHQTFQIKVQVTNLDAGSFTNPDTT